MEVVVYPRNLTTDASKKTYPRKVEQTHIDLFPKAQLYNTVRSHADTESPPFVAIIVDKTTFPTDFKIRGVRGGMGSKGSKESKGSKGSKGSNRWFDSN